MAPHKIKRTSKNNSQFLDGILPFTEKPSNQYFNEKDDMKHQEIQASDLFSLFTANIIKEEVTFVR
jgi:hypothetical protein